MDERQARLTQAKGQYKTALRNLEMISDEIHERRRSSVFGPRGRGVGSEDDSVSGADDVSSIKLESDGFSGETSKTPPTPSSQVDGLTRFCGFSLEKLDWTVLLSLSLPHLGLLLLLTVASDCFEDDAPGGGGGNLLLMSEEDSESRSTCSRGSSPSSPQEELLSPCPFSSSSSFPSSSSNSSSRSSSSSSSPPPRPCSLDLPMTVSLSDFGLLSPVLGPRSECSGASSPECDLERGESSHFLLSDRREEQWTCDITSKEV